MARAPEASPWGGGGMDWASLPGKPSANLPASVPFNGKDIPIYNFIQIDRLGKKLLKERAMNLRDLVGASNLPRFTPGMPDEQMVAWLIEAQLIVAASAGISLTVADLGAPKGGDGVGAYLTHLHNAPAPRQPPAQQQYPQQQQYQPPQQQQYQPPPQQQDQQQQQQQQQQFRQPAPPPKEEGYVVEAVLDVRTGPNGMASHFLVKWQGFPAEEATWEPAAQVQATAPEACSYFKQRFQQRQQQQQQQQQQQRQPPPQQFQQRQPPPTPPTYYQQQPAQYQPTDLRGNPIRSPVAPDKNSPMRPDQEADLAREAIRKRNMGSAIW